MSSGTERAQDVVYPFPLGRIRLEERGRGGRIDVCALPSFAENVLTS